jgi:lysophospholipase L1-like esterase
MRFDIKTKLNKYAWLPFLIINLILFVAVDFAAGIAYKKINGYAWFTLWESKNMQFKQAMDARAYRIKSYKYHHDLAKNVSAHRAEWGETVYSISTNSLGFKDKTNRQISLKTDKKRLVFIGDSFTEGVGLIYEKTFVGLIDETLKQQYEVLNAGVSSYSPIIYWKKIEHLINSTELKFDELIVYLDISDIEDEASTYVLAKDHLFLGDGAITSNLYETPKLQSELIKENTIIWAWLRSLLKSLRSPVPPPTTTISYSEGNKFHTYMDSIDLYRGSWTYNSNSFKNYGKRGLNRSAKHMDKLLQILRKNKIKITLAVYPWPGQIYYDTVDSKQVIFWENWANKNNVRFINHFKDFFQLKKRIGTQRLIEEYYITGDVHFNEKGNALIKESFLDQYSF